MHGFCEKGRSDLNIWMLSDWYPPKVGGIETHAFELTNSLRESGHAVTVFTKNMRRSEDGVVEIPCVKVRYLRGLTWMAGLFLNIFSRLGKETPDIIHAQSYQPAVSAIIARALRRKRVPIVMTGHGTVAFSTTIGRGWIHRNTIGRVARAFERFAIKHADHLISVDKMLEKYALTMLNAGGITLIPNWVDMKIFNRNNTDVRIAREISSGFSILCPRRLDRKNGLEYAIDAYRALVDSGVGNAKLHIVGDGDDANYLYELKRKYGLEGVVFWGAKPRESIPHYINAASLVLLPSPLGNFNFSLLEAWACEKPVLTVPYKDAWKYGGEKMCETDVDDEKCVLCSLDPADMASKIKGIKEGAIGTAGRVSAARRAIERKYSLGAAVERTCRVYSSIISVSKRK